MQHLLFKAHKIIKYNSVSSLHHSSEAMVLPSLSTNLGLGPIMEAFHLRDFKRAHQLFDNIPQPDPITCSDLISDLTTHGLPNEAIKIYASLRARGIKLHHPVFMSVIKACAASRDALIVKEVHDDATRCGLMSDVLIGSALIHAYGKCKCVEGARRVFDDLVDRNVVTWNSLSSCYVNCGFPQQGLNVCREMGQNGVKPDPVTLSSILRACLDLKDLKSGKAIHGFALRHGMVENTFVCSRLVNLYVKCLCVREAQAIFDLMPHRDVVTWNSLSSCYVNCGFPHQGLNVCREMGWNGVKLDPVTLLSILRACSDLKDLKLGKTIHGFALTHGMVENLFVCNALVNLYSKCLCVREAQAIFDLMPHRTVVTWTSLSSCYVNCGFPWKGLNVFREMVWNEVKPNPVSVFSILPACSELKDLKLGKAIHGFSVRHGMVENLLVCNALVNLYAKCLCVTQAQALFYLMPHRDVVSWNGVLMAYFTNKEYEKGLSLFSHMSKDGIKADEVTWSIVIDGCLENGRTEEAMEMLRKMQYMGYKPNEITIGNFLPVCSLLESLRMGKEIHCYVFRHWKGGDLTRTTALLDMYAKCGDLNLSRNVFDMMPIKDVVAWSTMIFANAMHGNGKEALFIFEKMLLSRVKPNSVTFTCVLSGCSRSMLVEEGVQIFNSMSRDHLVEPDVEHYSCVVDIYSRAGRLDEAYEFIQKMPMEPTASAWGALLGGCRVYKNVELAKISAKKLFEIEPSNSGNYVTLFKVLVTAKLWSEASKIKMLMKERGITKT